MDVNAVGLPTNRPQLEQSSASPGATEVPGAKTYDGAQSDLAKVNTAKAALPGGVGTRVDKSA